MTGLCFFMLYTMKSSNGNIFRVTGPLCGEFTVPGDFPTQRPVTRSFDVFFDLRLNKRLSKQPWGWWFQTPSWSLWRQCNGGDWLYRVNPSHSIDSNSWDVVDDSMRIKLQSVIRILLAFCGTFLIFDHTYRRSVHGKTACMTQCRIERGVSNTVKVAVSWKVKGLILGRIEKADFNNLSSTFSKKTENITQILDLEKASPAVASPNGPIHSNRPQEKPQLEVCPRNPPNLGKCHQTVCLCHCKNLAMRWGVVHNISSLKIRVVLLTCHLKLMASVQHNNKICKPCTVVPTWKDPLLTSGCPHKKTGNADNENIPIIMYMLYRRSKCYSHRTLR